MTTSGPIESLFELASEAAREKALQSSGGEGVAAEATAQMSVSASKQAPTANRPLSRRRWLVPALLVLALSVSAASCDGGPPNGELTIRNETDRPIMWLSDASFDQALEGRFVQRNAVVTPGESDVVSYGRPPGAVDDNWCIDGVDFWVIVSKTDDVADFQLPIDSAAVAIEEHLVGQCWKGRVDEYVVS